MPGIFRLKGSAKSFSWGGKSFIPSLLGMDNSKSVPYAEYWLGSHSKDTSFIELSPGKEQPLQDYLPKYINESGSASKPHALSFLLKILDVNTMLSIQVHPNKKQAVKGFEDENAFGIAMDSPERNYRDDNHKPELMVALSEFWLLHGFKPEDQLRQTLATTIELNELINVFDKSNIKGLFKWVMESDQAETDRILKPLLDRIIPLYMEQKLPQGSPDFWAAKAALHFGHDKEIDRGIFSIYFLNLIKLEKGEGISQAAGLPHSYLSGQNVEIMANSDNVMRGGLTPKHIDVKELLNVMVFERTEPAIIHGKQLNESEILYPAPVEDFELRMIELGTGTSLSFSTTSFEIFMLTEGKAWISDGTNKMILSKGSIAVLALPGTEIKVEGEGGAVIFRALLPVKGH